MTTAHAIVTDAELTSLVENAKLTIAAQGLSYDEDELTEMISSALGRAREATDTQSKRPVVDVTVGAGLKSAARSTSDVELTDEFYVSPDTTEFLRWHIEGSRSGAVNGAALLVGPSGSGKTELVTRTARDMDIPIHVINCASIKDIDNWLGHKEVDHSGTYFVLSDVMRAVRGRPELDGDRFEPGIVLFDEITRLPPVFHNVLFPMLDGQKRVWIPEMHDYIEKHPQTVFYATANIGGRYTGTFTMDHALRERLPYTLECGFPPKENETDVLVKRTGIDPAVAELLVNIANQTRAKWRAGELTVPISTRSLLFASPLIRDGASVQRAAELTFLTLYSEDGAEESERNFVRGIIAGKKGQ